MVKVKNANVTVYKVNNNPQVYITMGFDGLKLKEDKSGNMDCVAKMALQKAITDAILKWEFEYDV